jgi:hypothetical protein
MGTLCTPFVRASLEHPLMNRSFQMKFNGIEDHVQLYLRGARKAAAANHALIFHDKKRMLIEGIHGTAKRMSELTVSDTMKYQREAFMALKEDKRSSWKKFRNQWMKKHDNLRALL